LEHLVWNGDPELLRLGPLALRWYGLTFASGLLCGYFILLRIYRREKRSEANLSNLFSYIFFGTIIGARLGNIVLYEPEYYFAHPWEIPAIWHGGLASHGGFAGVLIAIWLYVRKYRDIGFLELADRLAAPAVAAACFIRIGNFFNSEIVGRPSDVPWAVVFLRVDNLPRHPVMLYEALAYAIIAAALYIAYLKTPIAAVPGRLVGAALAASFAGRFILEFFKEDQMPFERGMLFNTGQLYSVPFILAGLYLLLRRDRGDDTDPARGDARKTRGLS
jgi:prolipoprotein diacylglyceryl transferase